MRIARGELDGRRRERRGADRARAVRADAARVRRRVRHLVRRARRRSPPRPGLAPLDPSGLVKGWAVARAGDMLRAAGASTFFVNAGGDVLDRAAGPTATDGLAGRHPASVGTRPGRGGAARSPTPRVATSGRYERGDHVIDPRTGRPATGLASVTVVGPDLAIADAYATAAVVLGPDRRHALARDPRRLRGHGRSPTTARSCSTPGFDRYRVS